jgi:hypothetical protein
MYTVPEIGRLLQDLGPDADLDDDTEAVLIDWAVPWVLVHADDLVIGEPLTENGPGYYGVAPHAVEGTDPGAAGTADAGDAGDAADADTDGTVDGDE